MNNHIPVPPPCGFPPASHSAIPRDSMLTRGWATIVGGGLFSLAMTTLTLVAA